MLLGTSVTVVHLRRRFSLRSAIGRMGMQIAALVCTLVGVPWQHASAEVVLPRAERVSAIASSESITISWSYKLPAGATAVGFRVQKKRVSDSEWSTLANVLSGATRVVDAPPDAAYEGYQYRVRAIGTVDGVAAVSPWRWASPNPVVYTLPLSNSPLAPSSVFAELIGPRSVAVEWSTRPGDRDHARVAVLERAQQGSRSFNEVGRIALNEERGSLDMPDVANRLQLRRFRFLDNTTSLLEKYVYRVKITQQTAGAAEDISTESSYSESNSISVEPFSLSREELCKARVTQPAAWKTFSDWPSSMPRPVIKVLSEDYGASTAMGDDDYPAFSRLAADLSGPSADSPDAAVRKVANTIVIVPSGDYFLNRVRITPKEAIKRSDFPRTAALHGSDIVISNTSRFRILGCGRDLPKISISGDFHRNPLDGVEMDAIVPLRIIQSSDFTIEGLELNGNSQAARRRQLASREEYDLESRSSAIRTHAAARYALRDLDVHHFANDGIYIGNGNTPYDTTRFIADSNAEIRDVASHNNSRIALMIAQARNVRVTHGRFESSGLNGVNNSENPNYPGLSPQAGVDIEPNTVPFSASFGRDGNRKTYNAERSVDGLRVVLRKHRGPEERLPASTITGAITLENCLFAENQGRAFMSSLKAESAVPLTEDINITHSVVRATGREQEGVSFGLVTRNGYVAHNDMVLADRLVWGHNLGSATTISNQNEHASLAFIDNYVASRSQATNEGGRQPLVIIGNTFDGLHQADLKPELSFTFIDINQNPKAIFSQNVVKLSRPLPVAASVLGRLVSENSFLLRDEPNQSTAAAIRLEFGRSSEPSRRSEVRENSFSSSFETDDPNGTECSWSTVHERGLNLSQDALGRVQLCQRPSLGERIWELPSYRPLLPSLSGP